MTKQELRNYIKEEVFPLATHYGFTKWRNGSQGATCLKITEEAQFKFVYGIFTYNHYKLSSMTAYITFPHLELIVMPILERSGLYGKGSMQTYISNRIDYNTFQNYFEKEMPVSTETDLKPVIEIYKKSIVEDFVPYFDKFSNLNKFYHFIKDENDPKILQNWLFSIMHEFSLATIYRLCNDERYESYINDYYNKRKYWYEKFPDDTDQKRYWKAINELKEVLDRTPPIYNL